MRKFILRYEFSHQCPVYLVVNIHYIKASRHFKFYFHGDIKCILILKELILDII